jgi:hypothetical protein
MTAAPADEYVLDTPIVRAFIADVRAAIAAATSPETACDAIRPAFAALLADPAWLAPEYARDAPESGMGGGIGQWLLFRAADRSLTLFSLVVPSGSQTPVHDQLAWGLVGLDPPADERHRLRLAPRLRARVRGGQAVPVGVRERRVRGGDGGLTRRCGRSCDVAADAALALLHQPLAGPAGDGRDQLAAVVGAAVLRHRGMADLRRSDPFMPSVFGSASAARSRRERRWSQPGPTGAAQSGTRQVGRPVCSSGVIVELRDGSW